MVFEFVDNGVLGKLPNNKVLLFPNFKAYEDAYYDMEFEMNNGFEIELPEW